MPIEDMPRPCRDGDATWSPSWPPLAVGDIVRIEPSNPGDEFHELEVLAFEPSGVVQARRTEDGELWRLNPCFLQRKNR